MIINNHVILLLVIHEFQYNKSHAQNSAHDRQHFPLREIKKMDN